MSLNFRLVFCLIGFMSVFSPLNAQEGDWFLDKPIVEVRFEGLKNVSRNDLAGVTNPYLGKPLTMDLFRELQTKLYSLDYFEGMIEGNAEKGDSLGNSVILKFTVKEKPSIGQVKFIGNNNSNDLELQGVIKIKSGDLLNIGKVRIDEVAIREHYLEKGFIDVKVSSTTETSTDNSDRVVVLFTIQEGVQTTVKTIQFEGLNFGSADTLKGLMETKAQGFLESGFFKEGKLSSDIGKIQFYYWDRGYVDAKVLEIKKSLSFDEKEGRNFLNLVVVVDEGRQYRFGGFEFRGNSLFSTETLQALVRQTPGKVISRQKTDADYQRILDLYWEDGYIFNDFQRKEIRQDDSITYVIEIKEQSRAHIENIIVRGASKTKPEVILRELPIEEGDVFSKSRVMEGYENLLRLQFFDSVIPETPVGSAPGLMDLVINVQEAQTAEILFGLAFSGGTEFPISGQIKWQERNFMGMGQTFGVESNVSPFSQTLAVNFTETWLLGRRFSLGGTFNFNHTLRTGVSQDVTFPYSDSDTGLPDPYVDGQYVFTKETTYNGITYSAGDLFPGVPTEDQIDDLDLELEYEYDKANGTLKSGENLMEYHDYAFSLGVNTGYTFHTPVGRFGVGTGLKGTLQYLTYDDEIFRPASKAVRDNLNVWQLENQWWTRGNYDTRNLLTNPSRGVYLSETVSFMGGFLGGKTHLTRFDTKAEAYATLLDIPIVEEYTFKAILKARSLWQVILGPLGGESGDIVAQRKDLLYMDGMLNGRGWTAIQDGFSFWSNTLELRMPILESLLWFDLFADAFVFTGEENRVFTTDPMLSLDQFKFSLGAGLRVSNPQLPISIYLAKPFSFDSSGQVKWGTGDGIFGNLDLKFVLALGFETF